TLRPSRGPSNQLLASVCGNRYGSFSWKSSSWPTITVTGAAMVLARLPSSSPGVSLALASGDFTNTRRAGPMLALVGPHLSRSYSARRVSSLTSPPNSLWVRAVRKSRSRDASSRAWPGAGGVEGIHYLRREPRGSRGGSGKCRGSRIQQHPAFSKRINDTSGTITRHVHLDRHRRARRQPAPGAGAGGGAGWTSASLHGAPAGAVALAGTPAPSAGARRAGQCTGALARRATGAGDRLRPAGGAGHPRAAFARQPGRADPGSAVVDPALGPGDRARARRAGRR